MTDKLMREYINILLVEDNEADIYLTREILNESGFSHHLYFAMDGSEAISFLRREGAYKSSPCPDVILLDLNLPKKNGFDVLAEVKADPALKDIPVIILSTSELEDDVLSAYSLHADGYLFKPIDPDEFNNAVRKIRNKDILS
jgi:two-component system, chemotaxis family, response regulator Rcp1